MQRLAFLSMPLLLLSTPAASADLDGPAYRSPPSVFDRERVIERHATAGDRRTAHLRRGAGGL